jgi:hypothetical protein
MHKRPMHVAVCLSFAVTSFTAPPCTSPRESKMIANQSISQILDPTTGSIEMLERPGTADGVVVAAQHATTKSAVTVAQPKSAPSMPAQNPSAPPSQTSANQNPPPGPPPPPQVPAIPNPGTPATPQNAAAPPPDDDRRRQAVVPIVRARRPAPQQPLSSPMVYQLNFTNGTASPDTIYVSGGSVLRIIGMNSILYTYQVQVKEIKGTGDDLSQWSDLIKSVTTNLIPKTNAAAPAGGCQLAALENDANDELASIRAQIKKMLPDPPTSGNYKSISFTTSKAAWDQIRVLYDTFENKIAAIQAELAKSQCDTEPDARDKAEQLILDEFPDMRVLVDEIQKKADAPWQDVPYQLTRTSDFTVTVTEQYQGASTDAKPVVFNLNHGYSVLTLSGGFLLTKLQARSYTSVTEPVTTAGSSTPSTQNVLGVSGLGSGLRPALVALFNYHDPFNWPVNRPNFGLALSAGPVIDVSNGKADTSKFGVFVGASTHIWTRLFITAGVHFGEFSDFPLGYHAPGQIIPPNSGTPTGVTRWTGRLAVAITFRGKDFSGLVQTSNNSGQANPQQPK